MAQDYLQASGLNQQKSDLFRSHMQATWMHLAFDYLSLQVDKLLTCYEQSSA
jgi:hypothetical protein